MRFLPLGAALALTFQLCASSAGANNYFHDDLRSVALRFTSLNVPDLEKILLPQAQTDGSYIFLYIWLPQTHRPTNASFEANIADFFDVAGAQSQKFDGWCYLGKPETAIVQQDGHEVGAMRLWVKSFRGPAPRQCLRPMPGEAGKLGKTQVIKDPASGHLSMVRSGHPTRFPVVSE